MDPAARAQGAADRAVDVEGEGIAGVHVATIALRIDSSSGMPGTMSPPSMAEPFLAPETPTQAAPSRIRCRWRRRASRGTVQGRRSR